MTTEELEQLLEGGAETQRIDFKESCNWNVVKFAKDIMALSNLKDGGYIVLGLKEKHNYFERTGVTEEHKNSFKIDVMKDQMSAFADPNVDFQIDFKKDKNDKLFIIITVNEFREIPVICKKDSDDTKAGTIYYRNSNRRIESAPVSNSYDMRDIIRLATFKMMRTEKELGFTAEKSVKKKLDDELEGL